jgi:hypothetical protein
MQFMYLENDKECLEVRIGDVIEYESNDGLIEEGEVIEVSEVMNAVRVMRLSGLLRIPEWVNVEDILSDDDIEFIMS